MKDCFLKSSIFPFPHRHLYIRVYPDLVNKAFEEETKTQVLIEKGDSLHSSIQAQTCSRLQVSPEFLPEKPSLENLQNPFTIFSGIKESEPQSDRFSKAVIFPVPADNAGTIYGNSVYAVSRNTSKNNGG